jgi:hypothetical protein
LLPVFQISMLQITQGYYNKVVQQSQEDSGYCINMGYLTFSWHVLLF